CPLAPSQRKSQREQEKADGAWICIWSKRPNEGEQCAKNEGHNPATVTANGWSAPGTTGPKKKSRMVTTASPITRMSTSVDDWRESSREEMEQSRSRPAAIRQHLVRGRVWLGHHAKQIAAGILKHHEIRAKLIPPGVARRPEVQQTIYLGGLVRCIEIEVDPTPSPRAPVSRLKRKIGPLALRITQDHPTTPCRLPRHVVESPPPESDWPIEAKKGDDDGPNLHLTQIRH